MRTLIAVLTLVMTVGVCAPMYADDEAKGSTPAGECAPQFMMDKVQDLNLTKEQQAKIDEIRKEHQPKITEAGQQLQSVLKEEAEKIQAVLSPQQNELVQTFKAERKDRLTESLAERLAHLQELNISEAELAKIDEIRKEFRPKYAEVMQRWQGVLTDQQKQAREEAWKAGKSFHDVMQSLNLSDEQKQKLQAIGKDLSALVSGELEQIHALLSPEQQKILETLRAERKDRMVERLADRIAHFKELNLSDEQQTKIEAIRKEYQPKVQQAAAQIRTSVRDEVAAILAIMKPETERTTRTPEKGAVR
jgi:Spy/CpxP family protein refolding chaperone